MLCAAVAVGVAGCGHAPPAAQGRVYGDPRAGLSIYRFTGCGGCHPISGVSVGRGDPPPGPTLDGEGGRRDPTWLRGMLPAHLSQEGLALLSPRDGEDLVTYLASLR